MDRDPGRHARSPDGCLVVDSLITYQELLREYSFHATAQEQVWLEEMDRNTNPMFHPHWLKKVP